MYYFRKILMNFDILVINIYINAKNAEELLIAGFEFLIYLYLISKLKLDEYTPK